MLAEILLPNAEILAITTTQIDACEQEINCHARTVVPTACCPVCQQISKRVHSRYVRHLSDLPCTGHRLHLHVEVRKFFCDNPNCARKIFTERMPSVAVPWSRRTERLRQSQQEMALVSGGEAGQRLARMMRAPLSADTLLRLIRKVAIVPLATPRVLGVDD